MLVNYEDTQEDFLNAILLICDYLSNYGEKIFQVMSRERRESIETGYEVTIDYHEFFTTTRRKKLVDYLTQNFYENKCLAFLKQKYDEFVDAKQQYEDNLKEVSIDPSLQQSYQSHKIEFEKILNVVKGVSNALD
jgi:hypothetical protein